MGKSSPRRTKFTCARYIYYFIFFIVMLQSLISIVVKTYQKQIVQTLHGHNLATLLFFNVLSGSMSLRETLIRLTLGLQTLAYKPKKSM
jgi:hypothetical protein